MKVGYSNDSKYLMIDHLHRVIKVVLENKIDYYPTAVALDLNNKIRLDVDIQTDDYPTSEEMIMRFDMKLNKMLLDEEILSYCIAVDTLTSKDQNTIATDTIAFMTKNDPEKEADVIYYSYKLNKDGKFEVTDIWEENRLKELN
jgi:hypothetical protein